jgi:hypothetical protein
MEDHEGSRYPQKAVAQLDEFREAFGFSDAVKVYYLLQLYVSVSTN